MSRMDSFDATWKIDTDGYTLGPYAALRLSSNWAIEATFSYSQSENDQDITVLSVDFTTREYMGTAGVHAQ